MTDAAESQRNRVMQFREDVKTIFKQPAGERVLEILKDDFIRRSSICEKSEHTHYRLGQKEVVQVLIDALECNRTNEQETKVINEVE